MRRWHVRQAGDTWRILRGDEVVHEQETPSGILGHLSRLATDAFAEGDATVVTRRFRAEVLPEGIETSDGRFVEDGAMYWRDTPLPFMWQNETDVGHFGAELVGFTDSIAKEGSVWVHRGGFLDTDAANEAVSTLEAMGRFGASVDMGAMDAEFDCTEEDEEGFCVDGILRVTRAEGLGFTGTPFPAFAEAFVELEPAGEEEAVAASAGRRFVPSDDCTDDCICHVTPALPGDAIAAAAAPVFPPAAWFEEPDLDRPTHVVVEPSGRIYGHAAGAGAHLGYGLGGPRVATHVSRNYKHFNRKPLRTAEGHDVRIGQLTLVGGHPDLGLSLEEAQRHYDDTRSAVADIAVGWDDRNNLPWFSGALRPGVTDEQVRILRASGVSLDTRPAEDDPLPRVAALCCVNVEGWPVIETMAASGGGFALVASGRVMQPRKRDPRDRAITDLRATVAAQGALLASLDVRTQPLIPAAHRAALAAAGTPLAAS